MKKLLSFMGCILLCLLVTGCNDEEKIEPSAICKSTTNQDIKVLYYANGNDLKDIELITRTPAASLDDAKSAADLTKLMLDGIFEDAGDGIKIEVYAEELDVVVNMKIDATATNEVMKSKLNIPVGATKLDESIKLLLDLRYKCELKN